MVGNHKAANEYIIQTLKKRRRANELDQVPVNFLRRARVFCDVRDFSSAVAVLEQLLTEQGEELRAFPSMLLTIHLELASTQHELGDSQSARRNFGVVAEAFRSRVEEKREPLWGPFFGEAAHVWAELESSRNPDYEQLFARLKKLEDLATDDNKICVLASVTARACELQGDTENAIKHYEKAAHSRPFCEELFSPGNWRETRLVSLLLKQNDLDRAREILEGILEQRLKTLPPRNPDLAFTRMLLANILIQQGELDRAEELLLEAKSILDANGLCPIGPKEEISKHLETIKAKRTDSRATADAPTAAGAL